MLVLFGGSWNADSDVAVLIKPRVVGEIEKLVGETHEVR